MLRFIAAKLVRLVLVLLAVSFLTFLMLELLPGDQATAIAATQNPLLLQADTVEQIREKLHLDDPLVVRYLRWLGRALTGDLGVSYNTGNSVVSVISQRVPVTLEIGSIAIALAFLLAIPFGLTLALHANSRLDRFATGLSFGLLAIPEFLLAIALVYVFAVAWGLFPTSGWTAISDGILPHLKSLALPVASLMIGQLVIYARLLRSDVIGTLQEDYIFSARAKGLSTKRVLFGHALRPSIATLMTVAGLELAAVIGGAVLIETIFALPGVGRLLVVAVQERDLFVVQGLTLLFAAVFVIVNTSVEVIHGLLDPRARQAETYV